MPEYFNKAPLDFPPHKKDGNHTKRLKKISRKGTQSPRTNQVINLTIKNEELIDQNVTFQIYSKNQLEEELKKNKRLEEEITILRSYVGFVVKTGN